MENLPTIKPLPADIEAILINGDIATLKPEQRIAYTKALCESLGLNFLTRPFQFIQFDGKVQLYATRACAEQLRMAHKVEVVSVEKRTEDEFLICDVTVADPSGRKDTDTAVIWLRRPKKEWNGQKMVPVYENGQQVLEPLTGNDLANAHMKVVTKAKRRATLSFCALGLPDESEIETIEGARVGREALQASLQDDPGADVAPNEPEKPKEIVVYTYDILRLPQDKQHLAEQMALASGARYDDDSQLYVSPVEIKKLVNALVGQETR